MTDPYISVTVTIKTKCFDPIKAMDTVIRPLAAHVGANTDLRLSTVTIKR